LLTVDTQEFSLIAMIIWPTWGPIIWPTWAQWDQRRPIDDVCLVWKAKESPTQNENEHVLIYIQSVLWQFSQCTSTLLKYEILAIQDDFKILLLIFLIQW